MAHKTISDDEMMLRALDLFRTYGFHGVSLKQLADSMGLEKASLYYRFPGGKDEIALAVVRAVDAGVRQNVFQILAKQSVSSRRRVQLACDELRQFYSGGTKSCTLDVMSIPGSTDAIREVLQRTLQDWTDPGPPDSSPAKAGEGDRRRRWRGPAPARCPQLRPSNRSTCARHRL